jgi:hypothetical protein
MTCWLLGRGCDLHVAYVRTAHVIDDFIDTHADEALPHPQWSSGLLDLGAKKNGRRTKVDPRILRLISQSARLSS